MGKPRGHTVGINVTVTVVDVPNEALEIDGPSAVRYAENGTGSVAKYSLTDPTETVQWVLSGADGNEFNIDSDGALTFNESPDYENPTDTDAKNDYLLTITAYTLTDAKTEFVRVQVTDINEPPAFDEGNTATRSVDSTAEVTDPFGDPILATDPDDHLLTYRLPDDFLPFSISPSTGQLWVDDELAENIDSYLVTVEVTDGADAEGIHDPHDPDGPGGSNTDDTIIVTVNVDGAGSNNAPAFPAAPVTFSFNENPTGVVDVGTPVAATDGDSHTLSYTLGGTDAGFFTIGNTSGQIQTKANQNYDFETKPTYSVTVTADDDNGGTADKAVTITLNNVEEDGTVTLSPTQPAARSPVTATLTDPDGSISGTSWQWAKSSDGNAPWADVGTNSASYTPPDADVNHYLRAIASYTDGEGGSKTATATTTQKVQTGTNRPPTFDNGSDTTREVAEDAAANANVGDAVEASDSDGDDLAYSLTGQDAGLFTIETGTGQVKVKTGTTLDYEGTRNSYTVVVRVTDSKNAAGVTEQTATTDDTIIVTINVTDANEAPEFDSANTSREVAENTTSNTEFGDPVAAKDPDSGDTLIYALGGTNATSFDINTSTGRLKTKAALDKETKATYSVIVEVRDRQADTNADDSITVTITVTDVNEEPEFPSTETGARNVPENTAAGQPIGDPVEADDPENDTLTYTLGGTDAAHFSIVGTSGQLQTKSALDKEDKASYEITVSVHDGKNEAGGSDTTVDATIDVRITVTGENDPPSVSGQTTVNHAENDAGTVATYTATDPEGVTTFTWTLSGDDAGDFAIDGGVLTFSPTPNFEAATDHDTDNVYLVTVEASDGTVKGTLDVTVTVTGVNEDPAFDEGPTTTRIVSENTGTNQDIGNPIAATDPDDGDTLTYTLGGTDVAHFGIVGTSGQLQAKSALERKPRTATRSLCRSGTARPMTGLPTVTMTTLLR